MKYIFYSYYIGLLLKGKLKAVQISLSAIITVMVLLVNAEGSINYILGKSDAVIDLLFLAVLTYSVMNLGYAALNRYSPSLVVPENKNETESERSKSTNHPIIKNKSYGAGIKSSPKAMETKPKEATTPVKSAKVVNNNIVREEMSAPELEINIESTEEFFQDEKEEWNEKYSGVINENYMIDITDVPEMSS